MSRQLQLLAQAAPDLPSITCGDQSVTRAQFVQRIDELAHELRDLGVGLDDMVTIALPNSVDWFVAFAATWRVGGIPQPISSRLPAREVAAILELADPKVVIGVPDGSIEGRATLPVGHRAPASPTDALLL